MQWAVTYLGSRQWLGAGLLLAPRTPALNPVPFPPQRLVYRQFDFAHLTQYLPPIITLGETAPISLAL